MEAYVEGNTPASPVGSTLPAPGDVIADKYRVEAVIGRGGMSVVYRATHLELDQQVAIKVLSAEALLLPEYVVRLQREARAVSRIRSDHVVRVHDIGELRDGGVPFLVMEYLSGLDLAALLARRGPFPLTLAIDCIMHVCEALAEAHALGIVHRDLKPANLFLTEAVDGSPCVKLLDFGISRMTHRHELSSLTDPGTVLGTPSYMAPEQMEATDGVDARSDIWALGTILYELLVGKPPYAGESLPQIFMKIMRSKAPRPSRMRADLPAGVDAIVARCLKIDAAERFQSVVDLAWALSTLGAPNARDSAARIARVLDKHVSADASTPRTLRSTVPPVLDEVAAGARPSRSATAVAAVLGLLAAASILGVMAARGAMDAGEPTRADGAQILAPRGVLEDAAIGISPSNRHRGDALPVLATARVSISAVAAPVSFPPPSPRDGRAVTAVPALHDGGLATDEFPQGPPRDVRVSPRERR